MTKNITKSEKSYADPRLLAERAHPQDGEERNAGRSTGRRVRSVTVNLSESPLGWLHAGEKLRADWERAHLAPRITMRWDATPVSGGKRLAPAGYSETEAQIAAKQRFTSAIDHLGSGLSDIAWRIICGGEGTPAAEKNLGWPARSGKLVLKIALDRLADFYRLPG